MSNKNKSSKSKNRLLTELFLGVAGFTSLLGVAVIGLSDEADMKRILEDDGYTEVQYTEIRSMACGQDDLYRTGFSAINANDKKVTGAVCSGPFKGNTIRLD